MANQGFLILQKPEITIKNYELHLPKNVLANEYKVFRISFPNINPNNYLGISRNPLLPVPEELRSEFHNIIEPDAQFFMDTLREKEEYNPELILEFDNVVKVFEKIINKKEFEIIMVRRYFYESNDNILGYDVGYWAGDHYSIIADTIITPTWHGPPEKD
jgi:hypothetical protein